MYYTNFYIKNTIKLKLIIQTIYVRVGMYMIDRHCILCRCLVIMLRAEQERKGL